MIGTIVMHEASVEKAIRYMQAHLADEWVADLSLDTLCRESGYSKSHFIGIFEEVTGTTPHHFLASLRIQRAKELLLTTNRSVTDISLDVGYESFPTFSRTFTGFVGIPPREFRSMPRGITLGELISLSNSFIARNVVSELDVSIEGSVRSKDDITGVIFVGTFTKGVPQGIPHSGTVLVEPGVFRIRRPSDSTFYLLAAMVSSPQICATSAHSLSVDRVASIRISSACTEPQVLELRPVRHSDPPLVVSLVALLSE